MLSTPGIYLEPLQPVRINGALVRSDIAAFLGYALRGPVALPVRVESWRQFVAIFGEGLSPGHLANCIKAFFENGGQTCYIYRIVDGGEGVASAFIPSRVSVEAWQAKAGFRIGDISTQESVEEEKPDPALIDRFDLLSSRKAIENPGSWGNGLQVHIDRSSLLSTEVVSVTDGAYVTSLQSLVGLERHSVVRISQTNGAGELISDVVEIDDVDHPRQAVRWKRSLSDYHISDKVFDPALPIRIDTVEITVTVFYQNKQVEKFECLGIHPLHSNSLHTTVSEQSQHISLQFTSDFEPYWYRDDFWPLDAKVLNFGGGLDGVSGVTSEHYLQALASLSKVEDLSIIAAPDLVLDTRNLTQELSEIVTEKEKCSDLKIPGTGFIFGVVDDGVTPLTHVTVTDLDSGKQLKTNNQGAFLFDGIDLSLHTLRFEKAGFHKAERSVQSVGAKAAEPEAFSLEPILIPRTLDEDEVLQVQSAMTNPAIIGAYRIALIDPPSGLTKFEEIRTWRSKLGDSTTAALFYPWLDVSAVSGDSTLLVSVPPCGHVAGMIARADNMQGPHRTPANLKMRFVKSLRQSINETQHGIINREGINLIRQLPGQGIRIFGARTLSSDAEWRYLNVRRLILALEKTLERSLQWAVFEPNNTVLRQSISLSIRTLLDLLWRQGALAGKSSGAAYRIKCDDDNNPQSRRDQGELLAEIGVAPSVPFEFIRIRFGRTLDAVEVTE